MSTDRVSDFPRRGCETKPGAPAKVAIWGDSYALAWTPLAWAIAESKGVSATSYTRDSCPPGITYGAVGEPGDLLSCAAFNTLASQRLAGIDTLIMAAKWQVFINDHSVESSLESLEKTVARLAPLVNHIVLLGPSPSLRDRVPRCIQMQALEECAVTRQAFETSAHPVREVLKGLSKRHGNVEYVELSDFLCDAVVCPAVKNGVALYWDSNHVSTSAARAFSTQLLNSRRF